MEIAKMRCTYAVGQDYQELRSQEPEEQRCRVRTPIFGWSLTEQDPHNNVDVLA